MGRPLPVSGIIRAAPPFMSDPTLACRATKTPDLWFPDGKPGPAAEEAIKLCRRCPKAGECLAWALETRQAHGIYGTATPNQRAHILKDMQGRRS